MRAGADSESTDTLRLAHVDLLSRIDVFEHLDRVALARLAGYLEPRSLHDGEVVFEQGDPADGLYIVARGVVCIYGVADNGRPQTILATAGRGQYFGEIALIVDESRTASVRAVGDAEVLCLERARFVDLIRRNPSVALAITAKVIGHLRSADRARSTREDAAEGAVGAPVQVVERPSALVDDLRATDDYPKAARSRLWTGTCLALSAVFGLGALAGALRSVDHVWLFLLLLGTAATLWASEVLPASAVGLSLLAAWVVFGIATPEQALAGFASPSWLFIVSILGLTAAVTRSGLLFRFGLLMVRRLPSGLFWQAGGLLVTGAALGAFVPSSNGRAALMAPLAQAVSHALRQRDRAPGAAMLGLAAWIGAGPMLFTFLNASSITLLAWGLLPEASRARADWIHWFVAALPLTVVVGLGSLPVLALMLRPGVSRAPSRLRLGLQLAVLGPLQRREWAMLGVLGFTLVGWLIGPLIGIPAGIIAVIALVGAFVSGNFDREMLRELNWDYILLFGVVLGMAGLSTRLGLDKLAAATIGGPLARTGMSPPLFIILVALLMVLLRVVLLPEQAVLVLGLALIPVAPVLGVDPSLVVVSMVSTVLLWHLPSQSPEYMVAYGASEGRLYSHAQARRVAFGFGGLVVAGLAVSVPYWHLMGLA